MAKQSPAITLMVQYRHPNPAHVSYTNRKEAVRAERDNRQFSDEQEVTLAKEIAAAVPENELDFENYVGYMNRAAATKTDKLGLTTMFTATENNAPKWRLQEMRNKLAQAGKNGSVMWQMVVSFDTNFLKEQGLLDQNGEVDQKAIKMTIRQAMPSLMEREGLSEDAFWWGNVHLNTDHVHVHIGLSELHSKRPKRYYAPREMLEPKGSFSQKTIKTFKSQVYHHLLNEQTKERLLTQEKTIVGLRENLLSSVTNKPKLDRQSRFFLEQAYYHLPDHGKLRYGSNARDFQATKWYLDKYIDTQLNGPLKDAYDDFMVQTQVYLLEYQHAYTSDEANQPYQATKRNWQTVMQTKQKETRGFNLSQKMAKRDQELRERLANRILKQLKDQPLDELRPNLDQFSAKNQQRAQKALMQPTVLHTQGDWAKLGYRLKPDLEMAGVDLIRPEKTETGTNFISETYWDLKQVEPDPKRQNEPRLKLYQALWLDTGELDELIDKTKQGPLDAKMRQELGVYRSARRLKSLAEQKEKLQARQQILRDYQPVASAKPLLELKQTEIAQALKLVDLQLKPKRKRTPEEQEQLNKLQKQSVSVIALPINQATPELIASRIKQLEKEGQLALQANSEAALAIVAGQEISPTEYQTHLKQEMQVLYLKGAIYQHNQQLTVTNDEGQTKRLRVANGQAFNELRQLYQQLDPKAYPTEVVKAEREGKLQPLGNPLGRQIGSKPQLAAYHPQPKLAPPTREAIRATNLMLRSTGRREMQILWQKWHEDERAARAKEAEEEQGRSR